MHSFCFLRLSLLFSALVENKNGNFSVSLFILYGSCLPKRWRCRRGARFWGSRRCSSRTPCVSGPAAAAVGWPWLQDQIETPTHAARSYLPDTHTKRREINASARGHHPKHHQKRYMQERPGKRPGAVTKRAEIIRLRDAPRIVGEFMFMRFQSGQSEELSNSFHRHAHALFIGSNLHIRNVS